VIARCGLPAIHPDSGEVPGIDARFRALLVRPDSLQAVRAGFKLSDCAAAGFADRKRHVLWLSDLVEINKKPTTGLLPPFRQKQYEITFDFLAGPGYMETQQYVVEPRGIQSVPGSSEVTFAGWRVTQYRLLGWSFHWGDNLGHGSGVRLPQ
jgi:hypothetical protein